MIEPTFPATATAEHAAESGPDPLAFTPVPRQRPRHTGWNPGRQRAFIEHLADLGSVRAAANRVGLTPETAYYLRRQPGAESFAAAWSAALAHGIQRLEDIAMDRALHGVEVPVYVYAYAYAYGNVIGTRTVYNDALLMFLLRNRAAHRFNADSLNTNDAATRSQFDRLKRQWRAEWQAEQDAKDQYDADEVLASLDAKLERMRQRSLTARDEPALESLTPEQLAAEVEAEIAADRAANSKPAFPPPGPKPLKPKPPRIAPLGSPLAAEWLVHLEEGRIGEKTRPVDSG